MSIQSAGGFRLSNMSSPLPHTTVNRRPVISTTVLPNFRAGGTGPSAAANLSRNSIPNATLQNRTAQSTPTLQQQARAQLSGHRMPCRTVQAYMLNSRR